MGALIVIIALEGLPGAGKTTTAKLLAERGWCTYLHERSSEHPFLAAFYSNVERYKLETELCFVLLHYHQYRDVKTDRGETVVLDYSPAKDLVFADVNLTGVDYEVFSTVYERTSGSLPVPDVTVFLQLELDHTLARIRGRDREYERDIDPNYLRRVAAAYEARWGQLGHRVERVPIGASWTPDEVADAVVTAGLARATVSPVRASQD